MNIFFRVLLAVYAFCLAIVSTLAMIVALRPDAFERIYLYMTDGVLSDVGARVIMFLIALVFFGLSLTFLLSGIRSSKDKRAVSKYTNIGEIVISLNSIENIVLNASKRLNGIKDSKASVTRMGDGVSIVIKAVVMPDVNIPTLSEDIQLRVKKSVEESTGVNVSDVKVIIENIFAGSIYKPRVE